MALGLDLTGNKAAIVPYVRKGSFTIFVKETDSVGSPLTTGDGTIWQAIGYTKDTKFGPTSSQYKEKDDTNSDVVNINTTESYKVEFTAMQRNAASRRMAQNAQGKFYQAVLVGANIGTLCEFHALAICTIGNAWSEDVGGTGQISGHMIETISNATSITVTPSTTLTASTLTIPAGEMWYTDDLVHA